MQFEEKKNQTLVQFKLEASSFKNPIASSCCLRINNFGFGFN